jgi:hypothetical protein
VLRFAADVATPNPALIDEIPGRLCADPTDLSGAYPFGGVALGATRDHRFRVGRTNHRVEAEEFGRVTEVVYLGEAAVFVAVMRTLDSDMLARIFAGVTTGASTGRAIVQPADSTDTERAGRRLDGLKLYFAPDNDQHHGVLLYRAVPLLEEAAEVTFRLGAEVGLAVAFLATPEASRSKPYAIGPRADLVALL